MAHLIQLVARQAYKTFKLPFKDTAFQENFKELGRQVAKLTAEDINFDDNLVSVNYESSNRDAPVTYLQLCENDIFSMGVFVLRNGARIPLHDHPDMYGIIKTIHGSLKITSYSALKNEIQTSNLKLKLRPWQHPKAAKLEYQRIVTSQHGGCCLGPEEGNIHLIEAVNGPTAFLDILAPPYDHEPGGRDCHYYQEVSPSVIDGASNAGVKWLLETSQPRDFWCDLSEYRGPKIEI